jgi:LysR family hydrogen peroxide-inducible transcriptional activator
VLVCLRADDPLASAATLPQDVIAARLCILFARVHQPALYDQFERTFAKAGIVLSPSEFISAPAEMQYLVKRGKGFSLVQESTVLDSELTMRSITGINLTITTAFICNPTQIRPVLPMLAYRLEKRCSRALNMDGRKRPNGRAIVDSQSLLKKAH